MLAMVAFGLGEMFGGQLIGQVVDRRGSKPACLVNVALMVIMFAITFTFLIVFEYSWLAYLMCFSWGVQDSAVNTHVFEMLGFEFDDSSDAFAIYSLIQSVMSFIFQLAQAVVDTRTKYFIYTGVLALIGVVSVGVTYFF